MKTAFCTISTQSHLFKSKALLGSARQYSQADLFCLVSDGNGMDAEEGIQFHALADLSSPTAEKIKGKYTGDKLRWALKPVYLAFLIQQGYDKVIYCDNDIFFYASPDPLFDKLDASNFLLTPHFYPADPGRQQNWLEANFRVGLYNAGFIGVSRNGIEILDWWAQCCLYNVKKSFWRGLFDDQKYLDLVPVLFDKVETVKHKGCNLAGWNYRNYTFDRTETRLLVNGEALVFIHFAALSMQEFSQETNVMHPEYKAYLDALRKYCPGFDDRKSRYEKRNFSAYFYYLRWRIAKQFER